MSRSGNGSVLDVVGHTTVRISGTAAAGLQTQASSTNMNHGAYVAHLIFQQGRPPLETRSDYLRAIHDYSALVSALSAAMIVRFGLIDSEQTAEGGYLSSVA